MNKLETQEKTLDMETQMLQFHKEESSHEQYDSYILLEMAMFQ